MWESTRRRWGSTTSDKASKRTLHPLEVEAGKSYYLEVLFMKQLKPDDGEKKLEQCKLAWELDLTGA